MKRYKWSLTDCWMLALNWLLLLLLLLPQHTVCTAVTAVWALWLHNSLTSGSAKSSCVIAGAGALCSGNKTHSSLFYVSCCSLLSIFPCSLIVILLLSSPFSHIWRKHCLITEVRLFANIKNRLTHLKRYLIPDPGALRASSPFTVAFLRAWENSVTHSMLCIHLIHVHADC